MGRHQANIRPTLSQHFVLLQMRIIWLTHFPVITRRSPNVGLMLVHRLRHWPNIKPTLSERLVIAGKCYKVACRMRWNIMITLQHEHRHDWPRSDTDTKGQIWPQMLQLLTGKKRLTRSRSWANVGPFPPALAKHLCNKCCKRRERLKYLPACHMQPTRCA